jgi:hypothetical protein
LEEAMRWLLWLGILSVPLTALADETSGVAVGLQNNVVLTDYSPLSSSATLVDRLLTPLTAAQVHRDLQRQHAVLRDQTIDLQHESFTLFVPERVPPQGYALLVFISPRSAGLLPEVWIPSLERHGIIFVSAANSGNLVNVMERRVPLALLAAHNVLRRYPVDRSRVYIGGMSGGARVALRAALAYPDVFHGVLMHSESDAIGYAETPLPAAELFRQFQESTRLVYLSGLNDRTSLVKGEESRSSLNEWCVFDVGEETMPVSGHEWAGPGDFDRALNALMVRAPPDPGKLAACRTRKEQEVATKLEQVGELIGRGKSRDALNLLKKIDKRYGGLAAPGSVELEEKIEDRP